MQDKGKRYIEQSFRTELDSLKDSMQAIDPFEFMKAVELLKNAPRIGASGCGHSGIACMHFVHLMCCIGLPGRFISPAEGPHGAMGFLRKGDVMLFLSRGGKTTELLPMAKICREKGIHIITVTENEEGQLALDADAVLKQAPVTETDPYNCQGTTSTTLACMIFHALQSALITETGFVNETFAQIHPHGAVGERLN